MTPVGDRGAAVAQTPVARHRVAGGGVKFVEDDDERVLVGQFDVDVDAAGARAIRVIVWTMSPSSSWPTWMRL
ncbi:hypothetical protein AR457_37470 [Streptomyces agglomeratus]|uniref:Uncharacterized protein n=1 Tax=Streptomyces agglomeratus TaxID=285458 RepID=A0A1E5NYT6_9ACTN|nr:hypothetical protein AS594_38695 [Streptomyces agglomeratus]OEJ22917.1 hypothetical protein AR457_37470 [Streptomyces agglomeratus]OEJ56489.1 hypothetical protein BGM19_38135 [Streptomyces agglomeratus]